MYGSLKSAREQIHDFYFFPIEPGSCDLKALSTAFFSSSFFLTERKCQYANQLKRFNLFMKNLFVSFAIDLSGDFHLSLLRSARCPLKQAG